MAPILPDLAPDAALAAKGGSFPLSPPPAAPQLAPVEASPRLVLFDLDDTLCDYAAAREARLRRAFSLDCRLAADAKRLDGMVEHSIAMEPHGVGHFPRLFEAHGIAEATPAEAASLWCWRNRFFGLRLHADARETLLVVRQNRDGAGIASRRLVGLVTNGPAEVQRDKIAVLGLEDRTDFAVVSGKLGV